MTLPFAKHPFTRTWALALLRLSFSLKGAFAKNCEGLFARDFAPLGLLMNGFILGVWLSSSDACRVPTNPRDISTGF